MFRNLFDADTSTPESQRLDLNCSAAPIFETLSAGGHRSIDRSMKDDDNLDEYINNTLAQKFSELTINDPPPVSYASISTLTMPTLSNLEQQQSADTAHGLNDAEGWHTSCQVIEQAGITDNASRSSQLTPSRQNTKGPARTKKGRKGRKSTPFPMSIKRDLTPAQIRPVASSLVKDNALSFFLENYQLIYEAWASSLTTTTLTSYCNSVDESVIAAFDIVDSLSRNKEGKYLKLRFAYLHLKRAIDALDAAATEAGYIDTYLNAKKSSSDISTSQLSEYARRGKRWSELAGPSPFQLSVYSRLAETIVNNNSVKPASLKALAAEIQDIYPELVRVLVSFDKNGEAAIRSAIDIHQM